MKFPRRKNDPAESEKLEMSERSTASDNINAAHQLEDRFATIITSSNPSVEYPPEVHDGPSVSGNPISRQVIMRTGNVQFTRFDQWSPTGYQDRGYLHKSGQEITIMDESDSDELSMFSLGKRMIFTIHESGVVQINAKKLTDEEFLELDDIFSGYTTDDKKHPTKNDMGLMVNSPTYNFGYYTQQRSSLHEVNLYMPAIAFMETDGAVGYIEDRLVSALSPTPDEHAVETV